MLCFSHDWNGDPLSKTHLMRLLARENRILWVNSIGYRAPTASTRDAARAVRKVLAAVSPLKEPEPNLHVLSPLIIPAHGRPRVRAFNRWFLRLQVQGAMRRLGFSRPINWVFNPAAALTAGSLDEDLLIYYCVDEYAAFSGVPAESLRAMERELLGKADLVIASSQRLWNAKRALHPSTVLVRHGVDWRHFRAAIEPTTEVPADLSRIPRPVLGYFGLMAGDWVDTALLTHLARSLPEVSIVMIGRVTMDVSALRRCPNVHLLGHRPYQMLPAYCRGFDAAMIPFPISEVTLNSSPLKAREYLAAGLPVVSTAIPEVQALGLCRIAGMPSEFVEHVRGGAAGAGALRGAQRRDRQGELGVAPGGNQGARGRCDDAADIQPSRGMKPWLLLWAPSGMTWPARPAGATRASGRATSSRPCAPTAPRP
jgi:glycosyltransferase involved in cell wall biosynthesis